VHESGKYFASSGMDCSIRIWNLDTEGMTKAIEQSYKSSKASDAPKSLYYDEEACLKVKKAKTEKAEKDIRAETVLSVHFPMFCSDRIHKNYVDCVKFFGDLILSKSIHNQITLWKPEFEVNNVR
jgi:polycomb protein EED